jgi:hypothetical protein
MKTGNSAPYYGLSPAGFGLRAPVVTVLGKVDRTVYQIRTDYKYRFVYRVPTVDSIGCLRFRPRPASIGCTTDCPRSGPFGSRDFGKESSDASPSVWTIGLRAKQGACSVAAVLTLSFCGSVLQVLNSARVSGFLLRLPGGNNGNALQWQ